LNEFLGDGADHDGHGLHRDSVIEQRRQVDYDTEGDVPVIAVSPGDDGAQDAVRLVRILEAPEWSINGVPVTKSMMYQARSFESGAVWAM